MAQRKVWPPSGGKFVRFGPRSLETYQRGRKYYIRWRVYFEDGEGREFWEWSPSRAFAGRKTEAEAEAERYRQELEKELRLRPIVRGVPEWADQFQEWRREEATRTDSRLSPRTVEREELELSRVKERFAGYEFPGVTAGVVVEALRQMRRDGYSASALCKLRMYLSQVFDYAINEICYDRADVYLQNPCQLKSVKREAPRPKAKPQEALTRSEAAELARWIETHELTGYTVNVRVVLATGFRRGEGLGLSRGDCDLAEAVLYPRHQWSKDKKLREPKTDESVRPVPIDADTVAFLSRWFEQQDAEFAAMGMAVGPDTPVCTNRLGGRIDPDNFSRWRRGFFVERGLGEFTEVREYKAKDGRTRLVKTGYVGKNLHTLRHTQSTLLIAEGEDVKTVQGRLRHATADITMNTYTHTVKENDRAAAEAMGRILRGEG